PIVPKRKFIFTGIAVGSTQVITIAERIDISRYADCMVAMRKHVCALTGGPITFDLYGDGHSEDQPGLTFRTATPFFASLPVPGFPFNSPQLRTYGGTVRGHYAALHVTATRTSA